MYFETNLFENKKFYCASCIISKIAKFVNKNKFKISTVIHTTGKIGKAR